MGSPDGSDRTRREVGGDEGRPASVDPRVLFALDRTLLAWVRTALGLMGFGFVVARLGLLLRELGAATAAAPPHYSHWIGIALVVLGGIVQTASLTEYVYRLRALRAGRALAPHVVSPALVLGILLIVTAIGMAIYLAIVT